MPIVDYVGSCLHRVKVVFLHSFYYCLVRYDLILPYNYSFSFIFYLCQIIPFTCSNLWNLESGLRIDVKNISENVSSLCCQKLRHFELASDNFLIQNAGVRIFKRKIATKHSIDDNTTGPDIHINALITLTRDHFRSCVTR